MLKNFIQFILICFILFQTTSAIGVGVTPGNLNFSTHAGLQDTRSLFVINTGSELTDYRVYVDEDYTQWFDISPDNFSLNAGENKEVIITLTPPLFANGEFDLIISTVSLHPSSDFSVGGGIKVPVHTSVSNSGIIAAGIILALIGLIMILMIFKRRLVH